MSLWLDEPCFHNCSRTGILPKSNGIAWPRTRREETILLLHRDTVIARWCQSQECLCSKVWLGWQRISTFTIYWSFRDGLCRGEGAQGWCFECQKLSESPKWWGLHIRTEQFNRSCLSRATTAKIFKDRGLGFWRKNTKSHQTINLST